MKTKIILGIIGVVLVAAALVSLSTAAFVGAQNTTNPTQTQRVQPCVNSTGVALPYCLNSTTSESYCYTNGNSAGYCNNGTNNGYCQNNNCYGLEAQAQNLYGCGNLERNNGYGRGCHP
jgi:hypothetical protein